MATLTTQARDRIEPARHRAMAASHEARARLHEARAGARTRAHDAVELGHDLADKTQDAAERTRERAAELSSKAQDVAETAKERVEDLAETVEPTARQVGSTVVSSTRQLLAAVSTLPAALSQILDAFSRFFGTVAERGRETAYRVEPPRTVRRRSALRAALWFLGGFVTGAIAGWAVAARLEPEPDRGYEPTPPERVGLPVRPSDARTPLDPGEEHVGAEDDGRQDGRSEVTSNA